MIARALIPAAFAAFGLVAFGLTASPATPPASIDACKLLTIEDIASVTGRKVTEPVTAGSESTAEGSISSTCVWKIPGEPASGSGETAGDAPLQGSNYAMLNAWSWEAGSNGPANFVQEFRDAGEKDLIPSKPIDIKGVGDDALYWGDGVAVRKGTHSFGVSVHLVGQKATEQSMEEALARRILARLP